MKTVIFSVGFWTAIVSIAWAGVVPVVLDWEPELRWSSLIYNDAIQNNDGEDEVVSDHRIEWKNGFSLEKYRVDGTVDLEWRYETFHGLENESRADVRVREAYAHWSRDHDRITAGQKIVTWGKLDDLVILDRINPQDFTHFVLYDKQERKDPVLMLEHEWFSDQGFQIETIVLPGFEPSDVDFFASNWAVFGHLKEMVAGSSDYTASQKTSVGGITIQDGDHVNAYSLQNSQVALRLRGHRDDFDYGIYYLNLYHSLPVLRETTPLGNTVKQFLYDPTAAHLNALVSSGASGNDLLLTQSHPRIHAVGADWETVWGHYGLRGEMALFWGMPYLAQDFAYTEKNLLSVGIGIDRTTDSQWYMDLQYLQDYVLNYGGGLYGMDEAPAQVAGTVSKEFFRGIVRFDLDGAWNLSYGDWMLNPELTYRWERSGVSVSAGAFIFQDGPPWSLFGRYDNGDVIYVKFFGKF